MYKQSSDNENVPPFKPSGNGTWKHIVKTIFFSLFLLMICMSIIGGVCYYAWSNWQKEQHVRSQKEDSIRQELEKDKQKLEKDKQKLEYEKKKLEWTLTKVRQKLEEVESEKEKLERMLVREKKQADIMLEHERAESQERLQKTKLEAERDKALLRTYADPVYYYDGRYYYHYYRPYRRRKLIRGD